MTGDEMSSVREQLIRDFTQWYGGTSDQVADAILERWDLTPKPVVTEGDLGRMVAEAHDDGRPYFAEQGQRMLDQLANAGLTIVRIEETGE